VHQKYPCTVWSMIGLRQGFKMLATLEQHCCPDTVSNAFTTLMSLLNDVQGESKEVLHFCSWFDGMIVDMACFKIILPPILLVMLFLCALHSHYSDILDQSCSWYKVPKMATINAIVEDVWYHNRVKLVGSDNKTPGAWVPKASTVNFDSKSTEWSTPFEWLASYGKKGIKTHWVCALAGMGICLICHCSKKPWHVPTNCPLLKEFNLMLVHGPPSLSPSPTPACPPIPAPSAPTPDPSPGGGILLAHDALATGSSSSSSAASRLMAEIADAFDSDKEFCWTGKRMVEILVFIPLLRINQMHLFPIIHPTLASPLRSFPRCSP
jgi:hypothetical protein